MQKQTEGTKKERSAVRTTLGLIALPVTVPAKSTIKSIRLVSDGFRQTGKSVNELISTTKDSTRTISRIAFQKGRNDAFWSIFGGEEGEQLLEKNIDRFLKRKRVAIFTMLFFVIYALIIIIAHREAYGLVTAGMAIMLGVTFSVEAEFRLWQLRQHRLSREEKGSFINYFQESSILRAFDPELGRKG